MPVIRPAGAAMAGLLATLHAEGFPPAERWTAQAIGLLLDLPGHFGLIAETRGEPLGFVLGRVAAGEAEVLTIAVRPALRRSGVGRALLTALVETAAAAGAETLFLEVSESNGPARQLYAALGAVEAGRRRRYYADGTDALVLRLDIKSCGVATNE
ncbi:GNAT family N-acetyltransferase [Neoroseomonas marina]